MKSSLTTVLQRFYVRQALAIRALQADTECEEEIQKRSFINTFFQSFRDNFCFVCFTRVIYLTLDENQIKPIFFQVSNLNS